MMKLLLSSMMVIFIALHTTAQVAINRDSSQAAPGAMLDIKSRDMGVLIPRIALTGTRDIKTIPNKTVSLLIFNTATSTGENAVTPGYYYWNGTAWTRMMTQDSQAASAWLTTGNAGTNPLQNFLGTTDNADLQFKINNISAGLLAKNGNIYWGLRSGTGASGNSNIAIGTDALSQKNNNQHPNSISTNAVAIGDSALFSGAGYQSIAIGSKALYSMTTGGNNTAIGFKSLYSNVQGVHNVAVGLNTLSLNNSWDNTAIGTYALAGSTGASNTATGSFAMGFAKGHYNVANGSAALRVVADGGFNTALGAWALEQMSKGSYNTAVGAFSLRQNITGSGNSSLGHEAEVNSPNLSNATAIGWRSRVDCSNCLVLGSVKGINTATSNVNVGVGITNPEFPLSFAKSLGDKISFFGGSGPHYGIGVKDSLFQIHTDFAVADIAFGSGSSANFIESMRIKGNGNLQVRGSVTAKQAVIYESGASPSIGALLDVNSTNKGILIPRIALTGTNDASTISQRTESLLIYNYNSTAGTTAVRPGYYYWYDGAWRRLMTQENTQSADAWLLKGNSNTDPIVDFVGTTDNKPLTFRVNNVRAGLIDHINKNVLLGSKAGLNMAPTSIQNTIIGDSAFYNTTQKLVSNTVIGYRAQSKVSIGRQEKLGGIEENTIIGSGAGFNNSGSQTVIIGAGAGASNQVDNNIFIGYSAGSGNTTGGGNVFVGFWAGIDNNGSGNSIFGHQAGQMSKGNLNSFFGGGAGQYNRAGSSNVYMGFAAGGSHETGSNNVAIGTFSFAFSRDGNANTAVGDNALNKSSGNNQVAVGKSALAQSTFSDNNVAVGSNSLFKNVTGSNNTALGNNADVTLPGLTNSTVIGHNAIVEASNTMSFGNYNVTGWGFGRPSVSPYTVLQVGTNPTNGNGAYLSAGGVWTNTSDENLKENFQEVDGQELLTKISELDITQWNYKGTDKEETHIGPMAQQFKKLFDLGVKNDDKSITTLDASGVALVGIQQLNENNNELKKMVHAQQRLIESMEKRIAELEKGQKLKK